MNIRFCKPMECLPTRKLPTGEQWTYELKLDGFRIEAMRTQDRVILFSRQGKLLTSQFMPVAIELENLPPDTVLDGELVALDRNGVPRFNLLQNHRGGSAHLMYFAFDILMHKGRDVTMLPLSERRDLLLSVVKRGPHVDLTAWSDEAARDVEERGQVITVTSTTRTGMTQRPAINPSVRSEILYQSAMMRAAVKFGLNPLDRNRLTTSPFDKESAPSVDDDDWDFSDLYADAQTTKGE